MTRFVLDGPKAMSAGEKHTGGSNDLALLLGLMDILETAQEQVGTIDHSEVDAQVGLESLLNLLALVETHDAWFISISFHQTWND